MSDNQLDSLPEDGWVVVAYTMGWTEADIIAGMLRTHNIPVFIHQESVARSLGLTVGLGMIRVLVLEKYEDVALELLDANDRNDPSTSLDGPPITFPEEE